MSKRYAFSLSVALAIAVAVAYGVTSAAAQGGGRGGDVLLSVFEWDDNEAAVAYNSHAQEFLVVWSHQGNIYGQRYNWQGVPQGENFPISTAVHGKYRPAAAYSLSADSYLVVWEDKRNANDYDIYGQLVDADGTLLDNPSTPEDETDPSVNFAIYTGVGDHRHVDLAFDGSSYLIVWQSDEDGSLDIYGRFVQDDGTVELAVLPIADAGGVPRQEPAVAYNGTENDYLVVFQYDESASAEIHGRRVHPAGSLPGAEYTIADQPNAGYADLAAAAWGAYVVVWSDYREGSHSNIYGQVVLAGADNSFDGSNFPICTATYNQFHPAIARSPSTGQFLVVWDDARLSTSSKWDVYAQRLLADANLAGTNFAISTADGDQRRPAIAASQAPDIYFVAWDDNRSTAYDIYGQRVAWTGSLLWYEFGISAQPGSQYTPAVAYNGATEEYMTIWQDASGAIYGGRLSADGQPLEEPWAIHDDGHIHRNPAVACDGGGNYAMAWRDDNLNLIEICTLYSTGADVACSWMPESTDGDHPRLAYDDLNDHFLLVWEREGEIYAAATKGGWPTVWPDTVWPGYDQSHPDVAFDPVHEWFLVVWEEEWPTNTRIYGSLVVVADEILSSLAFPIAGDTDTISRRRPAVAYDPDAGEFLVVYEYYAGLADADIYGQRLDSAGERVGDEIVIRDQPAGANQSAPDVVYVPEANRYYVIWAEYQGAANGDDLYGRWLEADGSPASALLPLFRYPAHQRYPKLAYDSDHEQGLVVWTDTRRTFTDIYSRLGALDLEPPTARFTRNPSVGQPGTTFTFNAWPSSDNLTPRGALAVRWDWTSDGTWDTLWSFDKVVTRTVILPGTYTVTLEVRDLMWLTDTVSHAITVQSATGNTPPTASLTVTPASGTAGTSFTLDASGSSDAETPGSLQVRWDWEDDGEWDTDFSTPLEATHVYTIAGDHTLRAEVRDAGGLTDATARSFLVQPGAALRLEIAPASAKVLPRGTIRFRATAWDAYGNEMSNPSTLWWVRDPQAGTIDANGVFTASMQAGTYPDVILAQSGRVTATASVTIIWPHQIYLPLIVKE